jgi:hypothetical protein
VEREELGEDQLIDRLRARGRKEYAPNPRAQSGLGARRDHRCELLVGQLGADGIVRMFRMSFVTIICFSKVSPTVQLRTQRLEVISFQHVPLQHLFGPSR